MLCKGRREYLILAAAFLIPGRAERAVALKELKSKEFHRRHSWRTDCFWIRESNMRSKLMIVVLLFAQVIVRGDNKQKRVATVSTTRSPAALTTIALFNVTPSNISFSATDPDFPTVAGSAPSTATFNLLGGAPSRIWTLSVQASGSTFSGCTTVPVSAVTVTCSSAVVSNVGGSTGSATCSPSASLSTTPQQVASGKEGTAGDFYTITTNFTLTDSWKYIAATTPTCPITLTYIFDAP